MLQSLLLWPLLLGAGSTQALARPRPDTGDVSAAARVVADLEQAVALDAWRRTGAAAWRFGGREHLWDRTRGLSRVRFGRKEVLLRTDTREGRVFRGDREIVGRRCRRLLDKAWRGFINDSFWLQPFDGLRDAGVTTSWVEERGESGLLVEYGSGGVTPGDAYLWLLGEDGRPEGWRMWVKVVPFGGVHASWDAWQQLPTGAWVSTRHRFGPARLRIRDVMGAASLTGLHPGSDPFARLLEE